MRIAPTLTEFIEIIEKLDDPKDKLRVFAFACKHDPRIILEREAHAFAQKYSKIAAEMVS